MNEKEDALKLLMTLSRIEGFVISKTGLSRPEGIGEDLEQASKLCLKILHGENKDNKIDDLNS